MRAKLLCSVALILFIINSVLSQNLDKQYKKDSLKIRECEADIISLVPDNRSNVVSVTTITFPFSSFVFKDVRFDRGYIGAINTSRFMEAKGFRKVRFKGGVESELSRYFNDQLKFLFQQNNNKLLCFVKQLRLTQTDSSIKKANRLYTTARIELEGYLAVDNKFYPAVRLDTIVSRISDTPYDVGVLTDVLKVFAGKASKFDIALVLKRSAYSLDEVKARYDERLNKPILKDSVLSKGVYKTKEEFFGNNPSIKEYEFNKEGFLFTKTDKNEWAATREAFGFCDGSRIWINANKTFYPLIRQNDAFEFLADFKRSALIRSAQRYQPVIIHRSTRMSIGEYTALYAAANAIMLLAELGNGYTNKLVYQVNLETGEIF